MSQADIEKENTQAEQTLLQRVIKLRERYVTDRQFTLILSFLVGLLAAVAAFLLLKLIEEIQNLLKSIFDT